MKVLFEIFLFFQEQSKIMEEYSKKWFEGASEDLDAANLLFQNKKYRQAVFFLQQTCEKTAKGLLMKIGFLPDYEENEEQQSVREVVGIKSAKPRDYGHELIGKMSDALENMLGSTSPIVEIMLKFPNEDLTSKIKSSWNVLEFKNRLAKVREIKFNPNPSIEELDGIIKACNTLLSSSVETNSKIIEEAKKIKLPDRNSLVELLEDETGLKIGEDGKIMLDKIYSKPPEEFFNKTISSFTLMALLILNIYFLPHEWLARYPDSDSSFEYNESFSIVQKFDDISTLLKKCLDFAQK
jgi:hypothetical protein